MHTGVPTLLRGSLGKRQANRAECHAAMWWRLDITVVATGFAGAAVCQSCYMAGSSTGVPAPVCGGTGANRAHPMPPDDSLGT